MPMNVGNLYIPKTRTQMLALITAKQVVAAEYVIVDDITQPWLTVVPVIVKGVDTATVSPQAVGIFQNPDWQGAGTYSGLPILLNNLKGMWSTNGVQGTIDIQPTLGFTYNNLAGGTFTVGNTVIGNLTGATGVILTDDGVANMTLRVVSGDWTGETGLVDGGVTADVVSATGDVFVAGDTIVDGVTGAAATIVSLTGAGDSNTPSTWTLKVIEGNFQNTDNITDNMGGGTVYQTGSPTYTSEYVTGDVAIWFDTVTNQQWQHFQKNSNVVSSADPNASANWTLIPSNVANPELVGYIGVGDSIAYDVTTGGILCWSDAIRNISYINSPANQFPKFPRGNNNYSKLSFLGGMQVLDITNPSFSLNRGIFGSDNILVNGVGDGNGMTVFRTDDQAQVVNAGDIQFCYLKAQSSVSGAGALIKATVGANTFLNLNGFTFENGTIDNYVGATLQDDSYGKDILSNQSFAQLDLDAQANYTPNANDTGGTLTIPVYYGYAGIYNLITAILGTMSYLVETGVLDDAEPFTSTGGVTGFIGHDDGAGTITVYGLNKGFVNGDVVTGTNSTESFTITNVSGGTISSVSGNSATLPFAFYCANGIINCIRPTAAPASSGQFIYPFGAIDQPINGTNSDSILFKANPNGTIQIVQSLINQ